MLKFNKTYNLNCKKTLHYCRSAAMSAGITIVTLLLTACPGGGDGGGADDDDDGPEIQQTTTSFSCNGTRVWGPDVEFDPVLIYVSEANQRPDAPNCALFWEYDPINNCSIVFEMGDDTSAGVAINGNAIVRLGDEVDEYTPAGISVTAFESLPDCETSVLEGISASQGPDTNAVTQGADLVRAKTMY